MRQGQLWRENLNAAALSLLLPGWGQFEQGRPRLAWMQMLWALGASLVLFAAPAWDVPRLVPGLELAAVTLWSVVDALAWRPALAQRLTSEQKEHD